MLGSGTKARRAAWAGLAACGVAAGLSLGAMALLPLLIPAAELRRVTVDAISGATTRPVTMAGDPELRFLPTPRVVLGKVNFSIADGQSLDAEAVETRIELLPLLRGEIEVADVTLHRPTLVLTGRGTVPGVAFAALLGSAERPELRVVDGTIAWRSETGLTEELVSGIMASLDRSFSGKGVTLEAAFDWRETPVEAKLAVDDILAFLAGTKTPTRLAVASGDSTLHFKGQSAFKDAVDADGEVSVDATSLRDVLAWAGMPAPVRRGLGAFSLVSHLAVIGSDVAFTQTRLALDGNRGEGALLVKLAGARPLVQGTFAADRLTLRPYGRLQLTDSRGLDWSRDPIDLSILDTFDLDLRLSAGQVIAESTTFSTAAASAVLTEGRLVLALGQTSGWGGVLRATATLAPRRGGADRFGAAVHMEADCTGIDLERALDDIADLRQFEGKGMLQLDLKGEGRSIAAIARSLSGEIELTGQGGYLLGFDVAQVLKRIERRPLSGGDSARGGRTAYTALTAKATLQRGIATLDQMRLTGEQVSLDMAGTIGIGARTIEISGDAALLGARNGQATGISLPFVIQGPWSGPRIMADPLSLIQRSDAAQPLLEAARSRMNSATAVQSVIENVVKPAGAVPASAAAPVSAPN